MAIDLLDRIRDDSAIKTGGFTGAVFLTYSLNLTFFEQILVPALDEAGCSNVLIFADPDGYRQALEMGINSIYGVGLHYVCTPILRRSQGIQHGKMLFMAGPNNGRLFIGSGNLTFQGYGRNLEVYSYFEYASSNLPADISPFAEAWHLIQELVSTGPISAQQQVSSIAEKASWLNSKLSSSESSVWHNYDRSILEQLIEWRQTHGLTGPALRMQTISPYYDQHLLALRQITTDVSPSQLQIHLDPNLTNLDGKKAVEVWRGKSPKLNAFEIKSNQRGASPRHVHAKAIIGKEKDGSWIISGSANLSRPALLTNWRSGGNLELVTFFWSENPKEFDYLLQDELVSVRPLNLSDVLITETEPSERENPGVPDVFLADLNWRGEKIEGRLSCPLPGGVQGSVLHLQRRDVDIPVRFRDDLSFVARLTAPLEEETESARLVSERYTTPYRWIDQPDVLARHSARSYRSQIKGKIETIFGAEKLFKELMDFLLERVDPHSGGEEQDPHLSRRRYRKSEQEQDDSVSTSPPEAERFITDEKLVQSLHSALDYHRHPYDRSLLSLQDLLSLVLLRLTSKTQPEPIDDELPDDEREQVTQIEQEEEKVDVLQRLSDYIIRYCNRYADHLLDADFLKRTSPEVIFQNHYTLGKVLLEFENKARDFAVFSQEDLFQCFWNIWAPLVWPKIIGVNGVSTLKAFMKEFQLEPIEQAWQNTGMPELALIMFSQVLGQPPSWQSGLWQPESVEIFMVARVLIDRIKKTIGSNAFLARPPDVDRLLGIQTLKDLFSTSAFDPSFLEYSRKIFLKIERYHPPVEEKYFSLIGLDLLTRSKPGDSGSKQKLIDEIHTQGLTSELRDFQSNPKPILPTTPTEENEIYCPRCSAEQAESVCTLLERGKLVLCSYSKDAWIYLRPKMPDRII